MIRLSLQKLICILFILLPTSLYGQVKGVSVLIDKSASMRFRGNWDNDLRILLPKLVLGGTFDTTKWNIEGSQDKYLTKSILEGKGIFINGSSFLYLPFGNVQSSYPYFFDIISYKSITPSSITQLLSNKFPKNFNDPWTYSKLARSIARDKMVLDNQVKKWYQIEVSDFDQDTPPKYAVVDYFADSLAYSYPTTVNEQVKLTLVYSQDRRLQVTLTEVQHLKTHEHVIEGEPIVLYSPPNGKNIMKGEPIIFRWISIKGIGRYNISVRDLHNSVVLKSITQQNFFSSSTALPPGKYTWMVEGVRESGGRTISSKWSFIIVSHFSSIWIWIVLLGVVVALVGYFILKRKKQSMKQVQEGDTLNGNINESEGTV